MSAGKRTLRPFMRPEADLEAYLKDVGGVPLLEAEQEQELGRAMSESRLKLAGLLRKLPAAQRRQVTGGDRKMLKKARQWNLARVRGVYDSLRANQLGDIVPEARTQVARFENARRKLIVSNLRLVVHLARRFGRGRLPLSDLIQEGNIGLIHAVEKFEFERGHRFSTYAYWWIKQSIDRAVTDKKRLIRVPVHVEEKRKRVLRAVGELHSSLGRRPEPAEIARYVEMPVDQIVDLISLDQRVETVEGFSLLSDSTDLLQNIPQAEQPSPHELLETQQAREEIERLLHVLDAREQEIVRLRFGIGRERSHTLQEIGKRVRLSRERARQIAAQALQKMRDATLSASSRSWPRCRAGSPSG